MLISPRSLSFSSLAKLFLFMILTALNALDSLWRHFLTSPKAPIKKEKFLEFVFANHLLTFTDATRNFIEILNVACIFLDKHLSYGLLLDLTFKILIL